MRTGWIAAAGMAAALVTTPLAAQVIEYTSPAGVAYKSKPDSGAVARAEDALKTDSTSIARYLALAGAQRAHNLEREAIATYTRAMLIDPTNAALLNGRGDAYFRMRQFDSAYADLILRQAADSEHVLNNQFALGLTQFARGNFQAAADAFAKTHGRAPFELLMESVNWSWMSLARAGKMDEAMAILSHAPDCSNRGRGRGRATAPLACRNQRPQAQMFGRLFQVYRGAVPTDSVAAMSARVHQPAAAQALGNWFLVKGDTAQAKAWFQRAIETGDWASNGFIVAEVELARLK